MTTAKDIITEALHLFGIIDETEDAGASDIAKGVPVLNNLLRNEMVDGACQYTIRMQQATLPKGTIGQVYTFSVGNQNADYLVQVDTVAVRQIWMNDIGPNVNRETRMAPKTDVVRTTYPGLITKWHQERQSDGSVLVTAWQPPRSDALALLELGTRLAPITATDGSDVVALPPEGIHDATLLFGRRIMSGYGRVLPPGDPLLIDAEMTNRRWRDWARGQQWLRFVRA